MDDSIKCLWGEEKRLWKELCKAERIYGRLHDKTKTIFRDWCLMVDFLIVNKIAL